MRQESGAILTPKLNKHRDPAKSLLFPGVPEVDETKEMITMLGRQDRPIIVGPWLTEAGFELLYWIPFLAWAKAYASLHDDKLIIVSRGGSAPWYRHISPNYHDILSLFTAEEFRTRNDARVHEQKGRLKHIDLGEFDREIIERVKRARGLDKVKVLHPVADVQPLQRVLAPAGADHAGRGVQRVPSAAEAAARRPGARTCRATTSR